MILIAPDKFKGTLSAREVANIIAEELNGYLCVKLPMADGGEGTAEILCAGADWEQRLLPIHSVGTSCYYVNRQTKEAVIDSSAVIGIKPGADILKQSSLPLGVVVREILKGGCERVVIGVGGTGVCDGGIGFLDGLNIDNYRDYRDKIVGLCDVQVPLLPACHEPDPSVPSALMFAMQKGATRGDLPVLYNRLAEAQREYGHGKESPFDGAGGGLGFAIATAIGAKCYCGAQYVLDQYGVKWDNISLVITGEGCIDNQTSTGKVVDVVMRAAKAHGCPALAIGGCVAQGCEAPDIISTNRFYPKESLCREVAERRLRATARYIKELFLSGQIAL